MTRLITALSLVAMVAVAPVAAQQSRTALLQGAVVKAVTGEPIATAAVELRGLDGVARFYSNTSDRDGTFAFRNLPPGRYQLTAMRPGYVRGDFGLRGPGGSGITINLAAGQRLTDVRLAMRATGTIAGRVTDASGEGVGNVHVKALRFGYQDGRISLIDVKSVFTNDLGEYRLGWLPPGLYNVSALHPDALSNALNLPEVINSATIVGTVVTNPGGMNGGSFGSTGSADPAVRARLGLQAGEDYVPVYYPGTFDQRSASALEVRSGTEIGGVDLIVTPIRTASITGLVTPLPSSPAGTPGRVTIQVSRSPSYTLRTQGVNVDPLTGSFQLAGLAPGSYAFVSAFGTGDDRLAGHAIVDVGEGSSASVQVVAERGVRIPVRITVEGASPDADLSALRVSLRSDPAIAGLADTLPSTRAADGSLVLPSVVPGDYLVNVTPLMTLSRASPASPPPAVPGVSGPTESATTQRDAAARAPGPAGLQGAYVKSIRYGGVDLVDGRLRVDGRSPDTSLEILVGTRPGQIAGIVHDAGRRPAAHVTVVVAPVSALRHRLDLYKVTTTDAAGRFRVPNVPPDDYRVFAWEDVETGAWLDPQFMRLDEGRGTPLRIAEGASVSAEVVLIPAR